ncbi:MAG: hypothetical protein KA508_00845 [Gammaproteobacteria bacterium]|nr:hypothetical protein [Gammaproteobacteria bacterium]
MFIRDLDLIAIIKNDSQKLKRKKHRQIHHEKTLFGYTFKTPNNSLAEALLVGKITNYNKGYSQTWRMIHEHTL